MNKSMLPGWETAFEKVCANGSFTLKWGLPEPWIHAELFSAFYQVSSVTGWMPFEMEVPYLTYYPVTPPKKKTLPKKKSRDWTKEGAFKYADLCLRHPTTNRWCWFELKTRHREDEFRLESGAKSAQDALVKDYVGLCGLNIASTADNWRKPHSDIYACWMEKSLGPLADDLARGTHFLVSAYLQLESPLDENYFSQQAIMERIESWLNSRSTASIHKVSLPPSTFKYVDSFIGGHSLVYCQSDGVRIGPHQAYRQ